VYRNKKIKPSKKHHHWADPLASLAKLINYAGA